MPDESDSLPKNREKQLLSIVNASGFLFQHRVADEIKSESPMHSWYVASFEHPWENEETGEQGYADMVLKNQKLTAWRMVIECKRPKDARWVFLVPNNTEKTRSSRCLLTNCKPGRRWHVKWTDLSVIPSSPEALFCCVRGSGESDSMLERLSRHLLNSVDALAAQESLVNKSDESDNRVIVYFPVIVTSAELVVCYYDPNTISLDSGEIEDGHFKTVPLVRFTKSLSTNVRSAQSATGLEGVAKVLERTVFVIQAFEFSEVLRKWFVQNGPWIS